MSEVRAHLFISGSVHGVFFREHLKNWAEMEGVNGWVRNLSDGRVEAVLEGFSERVERVIELCRAGPPLGRVKNVGVSAEAFQGIMGFEIRKDGQFFTQKKAENEDRL